MELSKQPVAQQFALNSGEVIAKRRQIFTPAANIYASSYFYIDDGDDTLEFLNFIACPFTAYPFLYEVW